MVALFVYEKDFDDMEDLPLFDQHDGQRYPQPGQHRNE
jgi:hypothetical protein